MSDLRCSSPLAVSILLTVSTVAIAADRPVLTGPMSAGPMSKLELGRHLFESPMLSANGEVSCATCHDPERSFTDGHPQSKGILDVPVGRNASTLLAIGDVEAFPGSSFTRRRSGRFRRTAIAELTLEERCLAPIENPLEMGESVADVVVALNQDGNWRARFDDAFAPPYEGVTKERLGAALAEHVRSLELPAAPYRDYLDGDPTALTFEQRKGLDLFEGAGRCADCHRGPALTDGKLHLARLRSKVREVTEEERKAQRRLVLRLQEVNRGQVDVPLLSLSDEGRAGRLAQAIAGGGGYYGGHLSSPQRQTLTLWDVPRTGPYFRTGDEADLEQAVRRHVTELREVAARPIIEHRAIAERTPELLDPHEFEEAPTPPFPDELSDEEIASLMEFLRALSPPG